MMHGHMNVKHISIFKLIDIHNDLHVEAKHVVILREVKYKE